MQNFKKIKNLIFMLVAMMFVLNFYLFLDARNYVLLFAESYFATQQENKSEKLYKFSPEQDAASTQKMTKLSENELKELLKEKYFYDFKKLDKNHFFIRYYVYENNEFIGFSDEFILSGSRFYQLFIPIAINSIFALILILLYRQKIQLKNQIAKNNATMLKRIEKLELENSIDLVTQLKNRRMLERALATMKNPKILLVNIDEIKKINDYFIASAADDLLKQTALILSDFATANGFNVYRLEGDTFALVEDKIDDEYRYEEIVCNLLDELRNKDLNITFNEQISSIVLTVTVGLCLENDNTLKKAMIALRRAKKENKAFVCYSKFLNEEKMYFDELIAAKTVQTAILSDEIMPFYQPIFDKNRKIIKYESLVRIVRQTEEGTQVISPAHFLAISIKMKQYELIENYMIDKVIDALRKNPALTISVNLSGRDMNDTARNNRFLNIVRKADVANRLIIEVLEDENLSHNDKIRDFLDRAKKMGCKIAIDDFGSGFSNFAYMLELMPDYLKIDGSLIQKINIDEKSENIVRSIVVFAKNLGITTIAEFVSTEEIYKKCQELGIDEFQGFYLGTPNPSFVAEEIDLEFYKLKEGNA